jgi:hypothetical protein
LVVIPRGIVSIVSLGVVVVIVVESLGSLLSKRGRSLKDCKGIVKEVTGSVKDATGILKETVGLVKAS